MEGDFDDVPTVVTPNACTSCGRSIDSVCPGCGEPNTVVPSCDPPTRATLQRGKRCFLSPKLWFFCASEDWFCINPSQAGAPHL